MKLRNKLILSCAALAAVATTAVSTTYAWYTSNREVTASGITGQTASNGDDLLLISKTGVQNSWSASVDLELDVNFIPVYKDASGVFHAWDPTNNTFASAATTAGYITFDLYFKSGNASDLSVQFKTFNLTATSKTAALPTKSALVSGEGKGLGNVGANYSVDILRALTMEMSEGNTKEAAASKTPADPATTVDTEYQFNGLATANNKDNVGSAYNAHQYYNAVKGTTIETTADGSIAYRTGTTAGNTFTAGSDTRDDLYKANGKVAAATGACTNWSFTNSTGSGTAGEAGDNDTGVSILKVHFDIYLDGWDFACFDAVQGQSISLAMVFETTSTTPTTPTTPDTPDNGD